MREKGKELVACWNEFVVHICLAKEAWEEYRGIRMEMGRKELERSLEPEEQRFLSNIWHKSKFDVLIPRLVDYWRARGGPMSLVIGELPLALQPKERRILFKKF